MSEIQGHSVYDLFRYESGNLLFKKRPSYMFATERAASTWNSRFSGKVAKCKEDSGYAVVKVFGKTYKLHRLIWMMHGYHLPHFGSGLEIDHIDGDISNNDIENLQVIPHSLNILKSTLTSKSEKGVIWSHNDNSYMARVRIGSQQYLKYSSSIDVCIAHHRYVVKELLKEYKHTPIKVDMSLIDEPTVRGKLKELGWLK